MGREGKKFNPSGEQEIKDVIASLVGYIDDHLGEATQLTEDGDVFGAQIERAKVEAAQIAIDLINSSVQSKK